jgi:hypothetical protein
MAQDRSFGPLGKQAALDDPMGKLGMKSSSFA